MYSLDTLKRLNDEAVDRHLAETKAGEATCDYCSEPATHAFPVYNPADSVRGVEGAYAMVQCCDEHYDDGTYMDELFYCDECGVLFVTHHSWDSLMTMINDKLLCHACALKEIEPISLGQLLMDLADDRKSPMVRAQDFPGKKLLWDGEFSNYSDFPGHTNLKSIRQSIMSAAEEAGLRLEDKVYPLVTHTYQFSISLAVYY